LTLPLGEVDGGSPQRPTRILVVDDDPSLRRLLTLALEEEGYDVRAAPKHSGPLQLCRSRSTWRSSSTR
jgi:two-component system, OmpR family, KDP operon response regulator KdpE